MGRNRRVKHHDGSMGEEPKQTPPDKSNAAPSPLHRKADISAIRPRTEAQGRYLSSIRSNILTFGLGVAGTGKTFIAGSVAADMLRDKQVERMIFTRPAVEAGERMGFLPGTKEEKFDPYFRPYREVIERRLGSGNCQYAIKSGLIEAAPLNFIRGWTFSDCVVVLDEAQNCTLTEMKLFLTRIGENCKVIVSGDPSPHQRDIDGLSGLPDAVARCRLLPGVGVVYFTKADVVRSGLVQQIVEAYDSPDDPALPGQGDMDGLRRMFASG